MPPGGTPPRSRRWQWSGADVDRSGARRLPAGAARSVAVPQRSEFFTSRCLVSAKRRRFNVESSWASRFRVRRHWCSIAVSPSIHVGARPARAARTSVSGSSWPQKRYYSSYPAQPLEETLGAPTVRRPCRRSRGARRGRAASGTPPCRGGGGGRSLRPPVGGEQDGEHHRSGWKAAIHQPCGTSARPRSLSPCRCEGLAPFLGLLRRQTAKPIALGRRTPARDKGGPSTSPLAQPARCPVGLTIRGSARDPSGGAGHDTWIVGKLLDHHSLRHHDLHDILNRLEEGQEGLHRSSSPGVDTSRYAANQILSPD